MMALVEDGKSGTIITKDMSRIGRNYLEVGMYTEITFPQNNVRFIAINSGVDSANQQDNEFVPFVNIINEYYVRDGSKKVRTSLQLKGESGEHLTTIPPYGYVKDTDNSEHWLVDPEAAQVVKRIFSLCMDGNGPTQIARMLKEDHVLTPTVYQDRQKRKVRCALPDNPYNWNGSTVAAILERMEYCGHTVNFKTHRQSYKIKKTIENPPEQWKIFHNTHEAIVDEDTFQRVFFYCQLCLFAFKKHIGIRIRNCKLGAFFSDDHDFCFACGIHAQPAAIRNDFLRHLCLCDFKAFATGICTDKICGIKQGVAAIMLPYAVNDHNAPPI